jgi:2-phosphoglycerate kinase
MDEVEPSSRLAYILVSRDSVPVGEHQKVTPLLFWGGDRHHDTFYAPWKRYTQDSVTQCLQFMGCKPRRSQKTCRKLFWILTQRVLEQSKDAKLQGKYGVGISRSEFERLILYCLGDHPGHIDEATKLLNFQVACRVFEKDMGLIVLLCGTSGTGKSTLASLVASKMGISNVMSTDVIRNMLRAFDQSKRKPFLWSSTYEQVKPCLSSDGQYDEQSLSNYLEQRQAVLEHVEKLVDAFSSRKDSIVIEGVHLSGEFAIQMMKKYSNSATIVPFLVHISNREKHMERFAVRAKAMTLRPEYNRYVQHLDAIRSIQSFLRNEAMRHSIPQVDNTNVDRSVAVIHTTILGALCRDPDLCSPVQGDECSSILDIFNSSIEISWSSSATIKQIQSKYVSTGMAGMSPTATSVTSTSVITFSEGWGSKMMEDSDHESFESRSSAGQGPGSVVAPASEVTKSEFTSSP